MLRFMFYGIHISFILLEMLEILPNMQLNNHCMGSYMIWVLNIVAPTFIFIKSQEEEVASH